MKQTLSLLQKYEVLTQARKPIEEEELWKNTNKILYGPVASRRLGESVGINLIPGKKICSFNCVYCDVGYTYKGNKFMPSEKILGIFSDEIVKFKEQCEKNNIKIDYFTFCGNGEDLDHPEFTRIYYSIKKKLLYYFPGIPLAILTNGYGLTKQENLEIVNDMDINFIKLDAGDEETFLQINRPNKKKIWNKLIDNLKMIDNLRLETAVVHSPKFSNLISLKTSYIDLINYFEKNSNLEGIYLHNIDYPTYDNAIKCFSLQELEEIGETISKDTNVPIYLLYSQVNFREDVNVSKESNT